MDNLSRLFIFSPIKENKKFTNVVIRNISEISNVTKETSQILLQTLWHLCTSQIEASTFPPLPGNTQTFEFLENFSSNSPLPRP